MTGLGGAGQSACTSVCPFVPAEVSPLSIEGQVTRIKGPSLWGVTLLMSIRAARNTPTIQVLACGVVGDEAARSGRLVPTPFAPDTANVSATRSAWT